MALPEDETADRLDRYLDGVVGGRPPSGAGLDPGLAATVRRVHVHVHVRGAAPGPDAAFVARLEEELMHDAARTNGRTPSPFPIGRSVTVALPSAATPRRAPGRWPLTELVVVAVVLLTIASGIGAYRLGPSEPTGGEFGRFGRLPGTPAGDSGAGETVEVTIVAGWRVEQVAEELERVGAAGSDAFLAAAATVDTDAYDFLDDRPAGAGPEGYLFPDTYAVVVDDPAANVRQMLDTFDAAFTPEMRRRAEAMGLSIHEVLTLASLVERETTISEERPIIADVLLKRWEQGWRLDLDAPLQYAVAPRDGAWWPVLTGEDLTTDSPYNTYLTEGLPPGPIANPSLATIEAILFPADTPFYFFVATGDEAGSHAFAATVEEHQANVEAYRRTIGTESRRPLPDGTPVPVPTRTPEPFSPTHRIQSDNSINLRPDPSFENPPIQALAPTTPLQYLNAEAPTANPAQDGARWLRFRTEDGTEGWVREIDVGPYRD